MKIRNKKFVIGDSICLAHKRHMEKITNSRILKLKNGDFVIVELYHDNQYIDEKGDIYNNLDMMQMYYINKVVKTDNRLLKFHFNI